MRVFTMQHRIYLSNIYQKLHRASIKALFDASTASWKTAGKLSIKVAIKRIERISKHDTTRRRRRRKGREGAERVQLGAEQRRRG